MIPLDESIILPTLTASITSRISDDKRIIALVLFGSYLSSSCPQDIDLCLIAEPACSDPFQILLEYSGEYTGYGTPPTDITLFSMLPLYIKKQVIKEGVILYVRDEMILFDIVLTTLHQWDDYRPRYEMMIR